MAGCYSQNDAVADPCEGVGIFRTGCVGQLYPYRALPARTRYGDVNQPRNKPDAAWLNICIGDSVLHGYGPHGGTQPQFKHDWVHALSTIQ